MKIFNLYSIDEVQVADEGLKKYICLDPKVMIKSRGRHKERFGKSKVNIIERLANELSVPGHRGKKHKLMTRTSGKFTQVMTIVLKAFKIIETQTKENPVQVFVRAVENASPRDEITTIEYGGARYPQACDCSPTRRLALALRNIVHGAYDKSWNKKAKIYETLAQELILASNANNESFAFRKKVETEKQADAAR
jgi:small subunit ribosomal protein S7